MELERKVGADIFLKARGSTWQDSQNQRSGVFHHGNDSLIVTNMKARIGKALDKPNIKHFVILKGKGFN